MLSTHYTNQTQLSFCIKLIAGISVSTHYTNQTCYPLGTDKEKNSIKDEFNTINPIEANYKHGSKRKKWHGISPSMLVP